MKRTSQRKFWAVAATKYQGEGEARKSALELGVECPFLYYRGKPVRGERPVLPIFEGYLLVRVVEDDVGPLRRAKGVDRWLGRIPDREGEFVVGLVREDGYVHVEDQDPPAFQLGEAVQALAGSFRGHVGQFRGVDPKNPKMAMAIFELMQREVVVSLLRYDLRSAGSGDCWLAA